MSYHPYNINISPAQQRSLASGATIRLSHDKLGNGEALHLTKSQIAKCEKAKASNKGCTLHFSTKQIKFNSVHGSGFFSDMFSKVKSMALPLVKDLAQKGLEKGVEALGGLAKDKLGNVIQNFGGKGLRRGRKPKAVAAVDRDKVIEHEAKTGVLDRGLKEQSTTDVVQEEKKGKGFFSSLLKNVVLPVAANALGGNGLDPSMHNESKTPQVVLPKSKIHNVSMMGRSLRAPGGGSLRAPGFRPY